MSTFCTVVDNPDDSVHGKMMPDSDGDAMWAAFHHGVDDVSGRSAKGLLHRRATGASNSRGIEVSREAQYVIEMRADRRATQG